MLAVRLGCYGAVPSVRKFVVVTSLFVYVMAVWLGDYCYCFTVIVFGVYRCIFSQLHYLCRIIVQIGLAYHLVYVACSVRLVYS